MSIYVSISLELMPIREIVASNSMFQTFHMCHQISIWQDAMNL